MVKLDGIWSVEQINRSKLDNGQEITLPTGVIFTMHLYRCTNCRHLEMVDTE